MYLNYHTVHKHQLFNEFEKKLFIVMIGINKDNGNVEINCLALFLCCMPKRGYWL